MTMFADAQRFVRGCPECAVVSGGGRVVCPYLQPIPVSRPFQIIGVDMLTISQGTGVSGQVADGLPISARNVS